MDGNKRIAFLGASGTGKTTLAKFISGKYGIPFISGSFSDLVPETRSISHEDMLEWDKDVMVTSEYNLLNLRRKSYQKLFRDGEKSFVTDRSPLDSLAYLIYKLSSKISECEIENFEGCVSNVLRDHITHIIFIPFTNEMVSNWTTEDNHKRITNNYFQWMISRIMAGVISKYNFTQHKVIFREDKDYVHGEIKIDLGYSVNIIKVLILTPQDIDKREELIVRWLKK